MTHSEKYQKAFDDANNLCNSCTNYGCEFQSGIVRTKCAFYMPPHIEPDNCGNYVVISREDAIAEINDTIVGYIPFFDGRTAKIPLELTKAIMRVPSVAQKSGHWILDETDNSITCDKCGCLIWANDISNGDAHYCPNCGAKMER